METGTNILSYTGNAGLGTGANANIPVNNPNNNLDVINNTARNIMLTNHDTALKLYDQKIKDRDNLLQALQQGQIASGNIDPNDRQYYDEAKKGAQDAFYDMARNGGMNNQEALKNYYDKVTNLKNITDWAQHREISLADLQKEKAAQTLPDDIKLYDDAIQKAKQQPFWNPVPVVQKAFKYDVNGLTQDVTGQQPSVSGSIGTATSPNQTTTYQSTTNRTDKNGNVLPTTKTTVKTSPTKGLINNKTSKQPITITGTQQNPDGTLSPISYTPESYWDLGQIQKQVIDNNTNPEKRYGYQSFFKDFQDPQITPAASQKSTIESYNQRLATYSQQRGIAPLTGQTNPDGTPKYPDQINYIQNPDGTVVISETPQSFFAKHALASVNGDYVQKPQAEFNKDIANYNIQKEKVGIDSFYKHAMAGVAQKKADAYAANIAQQMKVRGSQQEQDNFLSDIYKKNLLQQPSLIDKETTPGKINFSVLKADNSLPVYTIVGNKPTQLLPIDAKYDYLTKTYSGGHYNINYLKDGLPLTNQQIAQAYGRFKKQMGSKWKGGLNDYLKEAIKTPNTGFTFTLQGANGITDEQMSTAAQRIISNTTTKKGQTGAFMEQTPSDQTPPTDEPTIQDDNSQ